VFAVCFTPSPIIVTWDDFFGALLSLAQNTGLLR
jgi:hypothetical protein